MRILITGGAGFLGSNLAEELSKNNEVVCIDNLYTGNIKNLEKLNVKFYKYDIIYNLNEIIKLGHFDQIYNLACPASPKAYQGEHAIETTKTCVIGILNMLELATKYNSRILQTSTSEVYGDPSIPIQNEEYRGNVNPIGIRSCYDEGKRCAESIMFDYNRIYGTDIRIARIFNTYGPKMDPNDGRVISNFITQALTNKPLTVYGNGNQTRSFCYVSDQIKGLIKLMNTENVIGPINIGNPEEFTMNELVLLLKEKIKGIEIEYKDLPLDDPKIRKPDISKAKQLLNWIPKVKLSEGLDLTIEYFKEFV